MVMKRGSDIDSPRRTKRTRSCLDLLHNVNNDRYSPSENERRGRGPSPDGRSLNRKSERRTYDQVIKSDFNNEHLKGKRAERDEEASVRVTNLTKSAADHVLREKLGFEFKKFGEISVRIVKHGDERNAVVYFRNSEDARAAKRSIEHRGRVLLCDRALNLEFNFPGGRGRHFSPEMQQDEMKYSRASSLASKEQRDRREDGVDFTDLDKSNYERRTRKCDRFYSQSPPPSGSIDDEDDPKATRTLFVGNLETSISRQDVRREFERFGLVEDVDIKRPLRNQGSTYAFVKFIDLDVSTKAKLAMQGTFIGRNRVKIGYGKSMPTTRLWVGGLGSWTSLDELAREFDRFGAIRRIDYNKGDSHAFILYDSLDAASVAAREMRGFQLNGRRLKIDFADLKQGMSEYVSHSLDQVENCFSGGQSEDIIRDEELFRDSAEPKHFGRERNSSDSTGRWDASVNNQNIKDTKVYSKQGAKRDNWKWEAEKDIKKDKWEEKQKSSERFNFRGPRTPSPDVQSLDGLGVLASNRRSNERTKNREKNKSTDGNSRAHSPPAKRPRKSPQPVLSSQDGNLTTPLLKSRSISPTGDKNHKNNNERKNKEKDREKAKNKDREKSKEKTKENQNVEKEKPNPIIEENSQLETSTGGGFESLQDIAKRFAVAWRGSLILKNSSFPVRLHLIGGNPEVVEVLLRSIAGNSSPNTVLRISQRLRLDQPKLEEVTKRMNTAGASGYCMLLALPGIQGGEPPLDTETSMPTQQRPLRNLVTYLKQKQAAGVVNLINPSSLSPSSIKDDSGVLHAFPPCQYSHDQLLKIAPHLGQEAFKEDHLVVVVIRGTA